MTPRVDKGFSFLPSRNVKRRRLRKLGWAAVVAAVALLVWCGTLYYSITTFKGVPSSGILVRANAGIVLGAALRNDKPSPGLQERLDHALTLYREGIFPAIVVTGGLDAGGATITEAEGMRNYLVDKGVPQSAIFMDTKSRDTYENLLFAKDIMAKQGWRTSVIVTHRYHGARAADIAKTLGYESVQVSVTDSKVMMMAYHEMRETLALVKWNWNKLRLSFG